MSPTDWYSVCQNATHMGNLGDDASVAAASGARALAVLGQELQTQSGRKVRQIVGDCGLTVSSVIGLPGWSIDGSADDLRTAASVLEAAAEVGCAGVLIVSGPAHSVAGAAADAALLRRLEALTSIAAQSGVTVMIEPLHPIYSSLSFVHTLGHSLEIAGRVPRMKIVFDSGHLWWDPHVMEDLRRGANLIATVQITDVSREALDRQEYRRCQLGDGVVPLGPILKQLLSTGYSGYFENEVICRVPRDQRAEFFRRGFQVFSQFTEEFTVADNRP